MKDASQFIACECHGHGIMVDCYHDEKGNSPGDLYIIVFGTESYFSKPDLWYRIKRAFKMLRTGKVPGGEIVLGVDSAAQLQAYISNFLIEEEYERV